MRNYPPPSPYPPLPLPRVSHSPVNAIKTAGNDGGSCYHHHQQYHCVRIFTFIHQLPISPRAHQLLNSAFLCTFPAKHQ